MHGAAGIFEGDALPWKSGSRRQAERLMRAIKEEDVYLSDPANMSEAPKSPLCHPKQLVLIFYSYSGLRG